MAVDSEVKRWAMLSFGDGVLTHAVINPTGSDIDTKNERASLLGLYGGIAIASPGGFQAAWARRATVTIVAGTMT